MRRIVILAVSLVVGTLVARSATPAEFTDSFRLADCTFSDTGRNPYFSLQPGDRLVLEGLDDGEDVVVQITVLRDRQPITFTDSAGQTHTVRTRVIEEREWVDDELVEVSRNFFARCTQTNDVFYFGEDVDIYEGGAIVSHEGAWRAGASGALPGLIMPGTFLLGSRYFQEVAPDVALDRAEHVREGFEVEVPAGTFEDCVEVHETTPLEPRALSVKIYCAGIGLVDDSGARLADLEIDGSADTADTEPRPTRRQR